MERIALLNALLGLRLFGGMLLGLMFGYSIRLAAERRGRSGRAWAGQVAPLALLLAGAAVMIWFVPPHGRFGSQYLSHLLAVNDLTVVLAAYGLGVIVGMLSLRRYPVPRRPWGIVLLDALVFVTLSAAFVLAVLSHHGVPIDKLPAYKWRHVFHSAISYAWLLTLVHHCGLAGRRASYLLTLLSLLAIQIFDFPQWVGVMCNGMYYSDFVGTADEFVRAILVLYLVFPLSLALCVAGLIVAFRRADRFAIAAGLVQIVLLAWWYWV